MSKLLRSGVRRYAHSIIFWLAVVVTVGVAIVCGSSTRDFYMDDVYVMIALVADAVMISWLVGREYEEGIFRNKVVSGHTKGKIFLSELVLGVGSCVALYLLFALIFICFNSYIFGVAPTDAVVKMFIDCLLANTCFAAILVTISCLIPHRAVVAIVNIPLVFGIAFASYGVQHIAEQEEYWTEYEYEYVEETDEYGTYMVGYPIEGSEYLVENPNYIEGPLRTVCETLYDILPYGHIAEYITLTNDWFGYDYYEKYYPESGLTWETSSNDLTVSKDEMAEINRNLMWSVIVNLFICGIGYLCFRKKELK